MGSARPHLVPIGMTQGFFTRISSPSSWVDLGTSVALQEIYQMMQLGPGGDRHSIDDNLAFAVWSNRHFTIQIREGSMFI